MRISVASCFKNTKTGTISLLYNTTFLRLMFYIMYMDNKTFIIKILCIHIYKTLGPRGGGVGWGTALQAGRTRIRLALEFFIDVIFLAVLWP